MPKIENITFLALGPNEDLRGSSAFDQTNVEFVSIDNFNGHAHLL